MLNNLDWLNVGCVFPPLPELERLAAYRDNRALFKGEHAAVLEPYRQRVRNVINRFADFDFINTISKNVFDVFEADLNYFQLVTIKTGDLVAGEPPTIKIGDKNVEELLGDTELEAKLLDVAYDASWFGDSVVRIFYDEELKINNLVVNQPDMWFPVVDYENNKKVLQHVLAWVECLNPHEKNKDKRKYQLKAQIHYKGYYFLRVYDVKENASGNNFLGNDGCNIQYPTYEIKAFISETRFETGLSDFAIVPSHNVRTSDSCFGISDYDRICGVIAELQVRYAIEAAILDKHSCPTPYVPKNAIKQDRSGEWSFTAGGAIGLNKDEPTPGYMTWDASLQANHTMIEKLEAHLHSLSEMGAVINDAAFGASQGFEALETRMTNARLKARRMSSRMTNPLKKIIALLSEKSDIGKVEVKDISIYWNDGLPNNEYREVDIAQKKIQGGLFDLVTVLMDHFDKTQEDAEEIAEKVQASRSNVFDHYNEDDADDDGGGNE